jgi:hypothetical protein
MRMGSGGSSGAWLLTALVLGLTAVSPALSQRIGPDDVELADVIEVQLLGRDLHAYDGVGSGRVTIRLELSESVLFQHTSGRIGIVLTDRRALAVAAGTGWREARYRFTEKRSDSGLLGDRVAIVVTSQRALAFNAELGSWFEVSLGPGEVVEQTKVGPSTAILVTDRRSLGMSPNSGGFVEIDMRIHERVERISALSGVATVTTSQRVLIFQGTNARWVEKRRKINE